MSKFVCQCGETLDLNRYPSELEGWLISQANFDTALATAAHRLADDPSAHLGPTYPADASGEEMAHDLLANTLLDSARSTVKCNYCGRFWIQRKPGSEDYDAWVPAGS